MPVVVKGNLLDKENSNGLLVCSFFLWAKTAVPRAQGGGGGIWCQRIHESSLATTRSSKARIDVGKNERWGKNGRFIAFFAAAAVIFFSVPRSLGFPDFKCAISRKKSFLFLFRALPFFSVIANKKFRPSIFHFSPLHCCRRRCHRKLERNFFSPFVDTPFIFPPRNKIK